MFFMVSVMTIASNVIRIPCIDIQPRIYLPKCTDELSLDEETKKTTLLMGNTGINRDFSLEFSINYFVHSSPDIFNILKYYDLHDTQITLRRYMKKIEGKKYNSKINASKKIILPNKKREIYGFNTFVATWTFPKNKYNLKRGCQLISIYIDRGVEIQSTKKSLIEAVAAFREMLGLENKSPDDFAFRFYIKIKRNIAKKRRAMVINISTFTFKLVFNENGYEVKIEQVDRKNYHFG